jgi:hypothetical protein
MDNSRLAMAIGPLCQSRLWWQGMSGCNYTYYHLITLGQY